MTPRRAMRVPNGSLVVVAYDRFENCEAEVIHSAELVESSRHASLTCCTRGDNWGYCKHTENCCCSACEVETLWRRTEATGVWSALE